MFSLCWTLSFGGPGVSGLAMETEGGLRLKWLFTLSPFVVLHYFFKNTFTIILSIQSPNTVTKLQTGA